MFEIPKLLSKIFRCLNIEVIETQDADMLNRFQSWLNLMHDLNTGITGYSTEYKVDITVRLLNAKLEPVKTRKLRRAWPVSTDNLSFNPMSKEALKLSVQWRFDWWD